ncbi:hypothetical protein E7Z53_17065 [Kocuria salina]|uniref:hypothetical protein n=1 Tax=Kocuria salina TaxID=1929416 RepID=UPI0015949856|nr:hypothetical protein [Kocuria salina]NVC25135.1 hypothetical protein [Kocuria salina]
MAALPRGVNADADAHRRLLVPEAFVRLAIPDIPQILKIIHLHYLLQLRNGINLEQKYRSQTSWRGWPHYFDVTHVLYPHGVPGDGTAAVVAVLDDDGAVAGYSLYVQDPLFP